MILRGRDTAKTYKFSDISLEYNTIFDEPYVTTLDEIYAGTASIPHINVISGHYRHYLKKMTWKIDVKNILD